MTPGWGATKPVMVIRWYDSHPPPLPQPPSAGTIPESIGNLVGLQVLTLTGTGISGSIVKTLIIYSKRFLQTE